MYAAKCSCSLATTAHHKDTLIVSLNNTLWESQSSSMETKNKRFCNKWLIIDFMVIFGRQFYFHSIGATQLIVSTQTDKGNHFCWHFTFLPTTIKRCIKWDWFFNGVIRWWWDFTLVPHSNAIANRLYKRYSAYINLSFGSSFLAFMELLWTFQQTIFLRNDK
jgi:hypothetical protein